MFQAPRNRMPFRQLLFTILAGIFLLLAPFSFSHYTSVVPGWHTTIYVGTGWWPYLIPLWLLCASLLYRIVYKRGIAVSNTFFWLHVVCTLLPLLYVNFGFIVLNIISNSYDTERLITIMESFRLTYGVIILLQILFAAILLYRIFSKPPAATASAGSR